MSILLFLKRLFYRIIGRTAVEDKNSGDLYRGSDSEDFIPSCDFNRQVSGRAAENADLHSGDAPEKTTEGETSPSVPFFPAVDNKTLDHLFSDSEEVKTPVSESPKREKSFTDAGRGDGSADEGGSLKSSENETQAPADSLPGFSSLSAFRALKGEEEETDSCYSEKEESPSLYDDSIDLLGLSVRALNALKRAGFFRIGSLSGYNKKDFMKIEGIGWRTADEICDALDGIFPASGSLSSPYLWLPGSLIPLTGELVKNTAARFTLDSFFAAFFSGKNPGRQEEFCREVSVAVRRCGFSQERWMENFLDSPLIRAEIRERILCFLKLADAPLSSGVIGDGCCGVLGCTSAFTSFLEDMVGDGDLESDGEIFFIRLKSFRFYIRAIDEDRKRKMIAGRMRGETLQEIGREVGVTRERVRQVVRKFMKTLPPVREDRFLLYSENYDFDEEAFCLIFDEPRETFFFLRERGDRKKKEKSSIEDLYYSDIPTALKKRVKRYLAKDVFIIDGNRVEASHLGLMRYLVRTRCKAMTSIEDFIRLYRASCVMLGVDGDEEFKFVSDRNIEAILSRQRNVLWVQGKKFRYYNVDEYDLEYFYKAIDLPRFDNLEISALKVFREFREVMREFDIRDEYELHNVLRKTWEEFSYCYPGGLELSFGRMPTLCLGEYSRDRQIMNLLEGYAPVNKWVFAEMYEETYGVKAQTFIGSYIENFEKYFVGDELYLEQPCFLPEQLKEAEKLFTEDFYFKEEARALLVHAFGDDVRLYHSTDMKSLGYRFYPDCIISDRFSSPVEYFTEQIRKRDAFDISSLSPRVTRSTGFGRALDFLTGRFEYVETAQGYYESARRLESRGITGGMLRDVSHHVADLTEHGEFFTVHSLIEKDREHEEELLRENEFLCTSVLRRSGMFSFRRIGEVYLFCRGINHISCAAFLSFMMDGRRQVEVSELRETLYYYYGVRMTEEQFADFVSHAEMYLRNGMVSCEF